ncbi:MULTISPECIES: glutamate 5-kinase [unclassified Methylophaga]|uniref:glutamate 5-kinase n=1 Tax=unclassified Methylophaga TaxID=2629249 RepID=UPI000C915472|nr:MULTISPECIES: glutamate 5-kinase [unclassified Methylophaga]MAK66278.1 glutamate 5-kinase [Methylophaga sp.]MAY17474.1 glutamate 5-kinase [Methylophaga sp.]MBN47416.1 glutamate 5-kinase [Methylophaga sp.]HAO24600.1 glutamate 5-kinase [Methylophaga sp.]
MENPHQQLLSTKRWVIKIGSALLTKPGEGLDVDRIRWLSGEIAELRNQGKEIVLVTSGSVAAGMQRLGWRRRPHALHQLQAAASVGQMGLIHAYATACEQHGIHTAQILLTHSDLADRGRHLNARSALHTLLDMGILPVVNENDTIATDEIRFGDNDTLAAMTANLVEADVLVILTDQDGLFDSDPRLNPNARMLAASAASNSNLDAMAGDSKGELGRGGMATKLAAARRAARSGATTVILSGKHPLNLRHLAAGQGVGTLLWPDMKPIKARQQWLAGHLIPKGRLMLDDGAVAVIKQHGRSILPVGVRQVDGQFTRGELVLCTDLHGREVARGLVNYNADEAVRIMGQPSQAIQSLLGYVDEPELIHRDNLVVTG